MPLTLDWSPRLRERVRANLAAFSRSGSSSAAARAAVAVVLLRGEGGEASVPLLLRGAGLRRHAGQMGLPGGRLDDGEDAPTAALRELHEELGVVADRESILGALDDFETRSGFVITPLVLWSDAQASDLRPAAVEIERLFVPSLQEFLAAAAAAHPGASDGFCLPFSWGNVYAPTAAMLYQFCEVAIGGRSVRVNDFYQPPFTWR